MVREHKLTAVTDAKLSMSDIDTGRGATSASRTGPGAASGFGQQADSPATGNKGKWSTRRTVAFVVIVCSAFWIAVFAVLARFLN